MKCSSPYPKSTYQECQRDLGHSGDHDYLGTKWARLEPAELDPAIADLLQATMPPHTWGVDERSFPIIVVETRTHVVWVDAETEDDALAYWADDSCDLDLDNGTVIDGDLEFERPDEFQRQKAFESAGYGERHAGPHIACPDCGRTAFTREWFHDPLRKCHGPIQWRQIGNGRAYRDFHATPVHAAARQAVAA